MNKKKLREHFNNICMKRDNYRCRACKLQAGAIVVHHITDREEMPFGGYVKENGITLCPHCHLDAERFHMTDGEEWFMGFHPNDLYKIIDSSYEQAYQASERLGN